jgi:hypothetical protein
MQVFNALVHLDEEFADDATHTPTLTDTAPPAPPMFRLAPQVAAPPPSALSETHDTSVSEGQRPLVADAAPAGGAGAAEGESTTAFSGVQLLDAEPIPELDERAVAALSAAESAPLDAAPGDGATHDDRHAVPDVIRADYERLQRRRHPLARLFAVVVALALLLGLPLQYAWFKPDDLKRRYPLLAPTVERFCAAAGCERLPRDERAAIRLVGRDVRVHPRYEGALEVRAVVVNDASRAQSFPGIRFTLFNVNGNVIASRVFSPAEYLEEASQHGVQMPRGEAIRVRLQLIAPEDTAVSFEFEFI